MELVIKGKNLDVTESLRDYAQKKLSRVFKNVDGVINSELELSVIKNPSVQANQIAEVTLFASGTVIRGEESSDNMYASIDLVADKIERQIRRYKAKLRHRGHSPLKTSQIVATELAPPEELEEAPSAEREIVRSKSFAIKPLNPEDAALQMELLGHDFFVFLNQETEQVNVIYHRKDGNYGLIEPQH